MDDNLPGGTMAHDAIISVESVGEFMCGVDARLDASLGELVELQQSIPVRLNQTAPTTG